MHKWLNLNITEEETIVYKNLIKRIKRWISKKVKDAKCNGVVLGVSGGIDSATLAIILKDIFGNKSYFYYLKTFEDNENIEHINKLNSIIKNIKIIDLSKEFNSFASKLNLKEDIIKANAKSRFFMNYLYAQAQINNSLVIGTDNFNEYYLGYFTKYGDGGCDLLPFANLLKSDIYKIAKIIGVPKEIINKKPSANLLSNKSDEEELGFSYEEFENYLNNSNSVSKIVKQKILNLNLKTMHKRSLIPRGPKKQPNKNLNDKKTKVLSFV
ncbi:NAD(+) synthase [Metamycoplasma phocicerebrale]|uniref:NH(3)-dependent NAD(+) synthetase n=1 Tax=Metamycoplasma phocicerebrale TaxID=142649 RepID=A0A3T0TTW4_9BACT|nr:NAD(+) synthase [Metamycoplasma phocicerebrale]AZZ65500.1 NAD(+) synthase [Metamycoplasma phocicerebrale]